MKASLPESTESASPAAPAGPAAHGSSLSSRPALRRNLLWRILHVPFLLFCRSWIRLDVRGREHLSDSAGGVLLINHQSFLDPLLVAVMLRRPVSFLARDDLFKVPVIGWILRNTHVIPISRKAARGGSIRVAIDRLDEGYLVGMFPEGTRSSGLTVGAFRPGFLPLLRRSGQPVIPVGIAGADRIMPKGSCFLRPGRVRVVFGKPLSQEDLALLQDPKLPDQELCELARRRVTECVEQAALDLGAGSPH